MDLEGIKEQARTSWGMGEYAGLSEVLRPAAYELRDACAVSAGQEVLDVAAGDGNFAIACAEEGASAVASDISPGMIEQGRARTSAEGWDMEWVEADVEDLPFEDSRFDCVGSVFGAMIAPRPRLVAEEMFRVVRPGNTVGMTVWLPEGPTYEMFQVTRRYTRPPEDLPRLEEWSREEVVRERFDGLARSIEMEHKELPWPVESPEAFVTDMESQSPMLVAAEKNLPEDHYARLRNELVDLARSWAGGDGPIELESPYVVIVARKRG